MPLLLLLSLFGLGGAAATVARARATQPKKATVPGRVTLTPAAPSGADRAAELLASVDGKPRTYGTATRAPASAGYVNVVDKFIDSIFGGGTMSTTRPPWLPAASQPTYQKYAGDIASAERTNGIPPGLLARQLYQESRYREDIISGRTVSSAGAVGIAQIVPKHHPTAKPLDARDSIYYAAKFMRQLYAQFGSWKLALAAYNAGPGNVRRYNGVPPFTETRNYVAQITRDVPVS